MSKLATLKAAAQQLTIDDYLSLDRDASPPGAAREGRKEPSAITAGVDPDVIMADLETLGDVSQAEIGTILHNGTCPYTEQCDTRRRRLPHYRPGHPCHWRAWGDWQFCPLFRQNGGKTND